MTDLIERINRIIAQCRDSKESAELWIEIRDEIERLRQGVISLRCLYDELSVKNAKLQAEIVMLWDQLKDAERRETEAERRCERLRRVAEVAKGLEYWRMNDLDESVYVIVGDAAPDLVDALAALAENDD